MMITRKPLPFSFMACLPKNLMPLPDYMLVFLENCRGVENEPLLNIYQPSPAQSSKMSAM